MKDYSKIVLQDIIAKARKVPQENRNTDGSLEIKVSDNDLKKISGRKRLRESLKNNIFNDLNEKDITTKKCDTDSLCIIIPKEKMGKQIINYKDIV
jgi:hypothetical protein